MPNPEKPISPDLQSQELRELELKYETFLKEVRNQLKKDLERRAHSVLQARSGVAVEAISVLRIMQELDSRKRVKHENMYFVLRRRLERLIEDVEYTCHNQFMVEDEDASVEKESKSA
jgi:hypothetical protein